MRSKNSPSASKTLAVFFLTLTALLIANAGAATVNWSAGINNGLSLSDGANLPAGSLARLGFFRDAGTGAQLTDEEILTLAATPSALNDSFIEAGTTTVGSGFATGIAGHFATSTGSLDIYVNELAASKCAYKVGFRPAGYNFGTP